MPPLPSSAASVVTHYTNQLATDQQNATDARNAMIAARKDSFKQAIVRLLNDIYNQIYEDTGAVINVDETDPNDPRPYIEATFALSTLRFTGFGFDEANQVHQITGDWHNGEVNKIFQVSDFHYPYDLGSFLQYIEEAPAP